MFVLRTAMKVPVELGRLLLEPLPSSAAPNDLQPSSLEGLSRISIGWLC